MLTVNIVGVVAVWDIVHMVCIGKFTLENILYAMNVHKPLRLMVLILWPPTHSASANQEQASCYGNFSAAIAYET